jgi:uncharacterized protein YeaO (DUF488 family)
VQDGLLLLLAMSLCGVSGWRLYQKNNSDRVVKELVEADEKAIAPSNSLRLQFAQRLQKFGQRFEGADRAVAQEKAHGSKNTMLGWMR